MITPRPDRRRATAALAVALALGLAACGSDDDAAADAASPATATPDAAADATAPTERATSDVSTAATTAEAAASAAGDDIDLSDVTLRIGVQNRNTVEEWEAAEASVGAHYDIEWSFFANAEEQQTALAADAIDVALDLGTVSLTLSQSNNPAQWTESSTPYTNIAVASPVDVGASPRFFLIARSDLGVDGPDDLAGHSISYKPGGTTEVFVSLSLDSVGLGIDDIEPVVLDTADAVAALRAGHIDVWAGGAAAGQALIDDGTGVLVVDNADVDYPGSVSTAVRSSDLDDPVLDAAYGDLVGRIVTWRDWVATHPDEDAQIFVDVLQQHPDAAAYAARANAYELVPIDDELIAYEQYVADTLTTFGILPNAVDVGFQYDARYNDQAVG